MSEHRDKSGRLLVGRARTCLVLMFLMKLSKAPVAFVPRGSQFQTVDVGDVAKRITELVMGPPAGRGRELGGPRVESMADLMRAYLVAARRRRPLIIRGPLPGKVGAAFGVGNLLLTDGDRGKVAFQDYLRSRTRADGIIAQP